MLSGVIAKNVGDVFFETQCTLKLVTVLNYKCLFVFNMLFSHLQSVILPFCLHYHKNLNITLQSK